MSQLSGSTLQDAIVDHSTSDGIHWQFTTGRHILKSALTIFRIGCVLPKINTMTSHYLVLKKHTPNVCFKCGSKAHSKPQSKRETFVKCSLCGSHSHNTDMCIPISPLQPLWPCWPLHWHSLAVLFGNDVTVVTTHQKLDTTQKKLTKRCSLFDNITLNIHFNPALLWTLVTSSP